jgi:hypothetical protein
MATYVAKNLLEILDNLLNESEMPSSYDLLLVSLQKFFWMAGVNLYCTSRSGIYDYQIGKENDKDYRFKKFQLYVIRKSYTI